MLTNLAHTPAQISTDDMRIVHGVVVLSEHVELTIACNAGGICRDWPHKLVYEGNTYNFMHQEVMERWMAVDYSGCARYRLDAVKASRIDLFGQGEE